MTESHDQLSVSWQTLTELLRTVAKQATFDIQHRGTYSALQLREIYHRRTDFDWLLAAPAEPHVRDDLLARLTRSLRILLSQYILDDRIGHTLTGLVSSEGFPITSFVLDLVRAAAILGPVRSTQLLCRWAEGGPVHYRQSALLSGMSVDDALEMPGGIRFVSQTNSFESSPYWWPDHFPDFSMLGKAKVSIDSRTAPALYRPDGHMPSLDHTSAYGPVAEPLLDAVCEALSLTCNNHVSWITMWPEFGDERAFGLVTRSRQSRLPVDGFSLSAGAPMAQAHMERARDLLVRRIAGRNSTKDLDLVISRWMTSKRRTSYAEQFIDLRIALEALYLNRGERDGEKSFRIATHGAWHLGTNASERLRYQQTLRDAYNLASTFIHAGEPKNSAKTEAVLKTAQDLCRQGILKRLNEPEEPNWNEMILGTEI